MADKPGKVKTNEGETAYEAGDYLVSNNEDGTDAYAIGAEKFRELYESLKTKTFRTSTKTIALSASSTGGTF